MTRSRVVELSIFLVLAIYLINLGVPNADAAFPTVSFTTQNATTDTYRKFINLLRTQLACGGSSLYDIPLLKSSVPDSQRFVLVDLTNNYGNTLTLALDVLNVNVVAYSSTKDNGFNYYRDTPDAALNTLFPEATRRTQYTWSNTYVDLERHSGVSRKDMALGLGWLSYRIHLLWNNVYQDRMLLSIIPMVSGAARFRYIEELMCNQTKFYPDPVMLSLEHNWSALSLEIQRSNNGIFNTAVELRSRSNATVLVDNVRRSNVIPGVALLRADQCYTTTTTTTSSIIRMPGSVAVGDMDAADAAAATCTIQNRTTKITGPGGWCMSVSGRNDSDYAPLQVYGCNTQRFQKWTLQTDGRILSSQGKCLTPSANTAGSRAVILNCDIADPDSTKWTISASGTITNLGTGLVLTAKSFAMTSALTVETDINSSLQGWRPGHNEVANVTTIAGYNGTCLQAINNSTTLSMKACAVSNTQKWALYSDGTIRVDSDQSLCVRSDGQSSNAAIVILTCQGSANERWVFNAEGQILNPGSKLVMTVESLKKIVLLKPYPGYEKQRWLPLF